MNAEQLRSIREAVAFAKGGKAQKRRFATEERDVCNRVYRAFGQPQMGEPVTLEHCLVRSRIAEIVWSASGMERP